MHEQPNSSDHARHDLLAVAALADRDATGEEAVRAQAQVDTCTECATLHAELLSLTTATRQLPAIERPRDFQLRPEDAQRLRPNRIRRLFGSFGTARDGFSRPLAVGLTTLGLAGLMVGILPGTLSFGGAASAPAGRRPDRPRSRRSSRHWALLRHRRPPRPKAALPPRSRARANRQRAWASTTATARSQHLHRPGMGSTSATSPTMDPWRSPANRKASPRSPRLDRRLAADRHLRDAAHRRARAVRPALDLAPLRRLTAGRPCRPAAAVTNQHASR